jgi:hypothetical protein
VQRSCEYRCLCALTDDDTVVVLLVYVRSTYVLQVPASESEQFSAFLDELGYAYYDETDNPVYTQFFSALPEKQAA